MFKPVYPAEVTFYSWPIFENVNGSAVALPPEVLNKVVSDLKSTVKNFVDSSGNIQTSDWATAEYGCQFYVPAGSTPAVQPPSKFTLRNVKLGISNDEFYERSRRGEIVVSDYLRASVYVRQTPGMKVNNPKYRRVSISFGEAARRGLLESRKSGKTTQIFIRGTNYFFFSYRVEGKTMFDYNQMEFSNITYGFHPEVTPDMIIDQAKSQNLDFTSLVTSTLAKANRSSVDVLTAFAELPKSIGSLLRGFKLVAGILRDAKKGQFDLNKAHASKKKKSTASFEKRIQRLQAELSSKRTSPSRRRALQKHLDDIRVKKRDMLLRSADELASESANLWLNYRYNIMPNVYLAQDIFDAVTKFENEFITARGKDQLSFSFEVTDGVRINVDCTLRCMIKRSFSHAAISKGQGVISNDIFVTAWELVPLSFVYDWFINIGDLLSAQTYSNKWAQEGATKSSRFDISSDLSFPSDVNWSVEPTTSVEGFVYERKVINPIDECGLVWQPSLGLERRFDALALIWRPVRSLLLKGKQR